MARTEIRGVSQIKAGSVTRDRLADNFVKDAVWTLSDNGSAVLDGLSTNPTGPNQAATKGYVDDLIQVTRSPDGFDASDPDGDGNYDFPSDFKGSGTVSAGDSFYVSAAGFVSDGTTQEPVQVGDMLIAKVDNPGNDFNNWILLQRNIDRATETTAGYIQIATQAQTDAGTDDTTAVTPLKLSTYLSNAGIQAYQFSNGLNVDTATDPDTVKLGGTLTENTSLSGDQTDFTVTTTDNANNISATLGTATTGSKISVSDTSTGGSSTVEILSDLSINITADTGKLVTLSGDANNVRLANQPDGTVTTAVATTGYVDSAISSNEVNAGNGLTKDTGTSPSTIKLGGTITEATTILAEAQTFALRGEETAGNYVELAFSDNGNGNTKFDLTSNTGASIGIDTESTDFRIGVTGVAGATVTMLGETNAVRLENQPDGTVDEAVATTKYVNDQISSATQEVYGEEPTVTDGSTDVTLANTPTTGTLRVYLNGLRQREGASNDYTVSGNTVSFVDPLSADDVVIVDYKY